MKKYLLVLLGMISISTFAQRIKTEFDQLVNVNEQWLRQPDVDPALKATPAKTLSEQQLIQFHLLETEKMLRKRADKNLSAGQKKQRETNLSTLHSYEERGVFPINDRHQNRQPYFIDKNNTYCAVGYLMQQTGAEDMARDIHQTQNYSYLEDISHPKLMDWANESGLSLGELALIQSGYPGDWPCAVMEFHYNNAGADVGEYLEIHESSGQLSGRPALDKVLLMDSAGNIYKTLLKSDMQSISNGVGYYYNFLANENFADKGKIILLGINFWSLLDTIEITTYSDTAVDEKEYCCQGTVLKSRHFSAGENENTPLGTSLTYCGFYYDPTWSLQSKPATLGYPNPCIILPIALGNFSCQILNKKVELNWETLSENNTKYFAVERSSDGVNFTTIGKINAAGNSSNRKTYSFTDNNPRYINHYRIKQVDADGKISYTKMLFVKLPQANPIEVYSNVVKNDLQIAIHLSSVEIACLQLYDFSGKMVRQFKATEGNQSLQFSGLSSGSYLLQLLAKDGHTYSQKVIK